MVKPHRIDSLFRRYQRRGDPADLGRVFDAAAPEMLQIAKGYARGDDALAEDALQSAFLVAMQKAADFDGGKRVMPWLLGILANELRHERQRAERVPHPAWLQEGADARHPEDPRAAAADAELKALVESKVSELPETYREAVRLHLFSAKSAEELAGLLGISPGALHVRVHRGLGMLRGLLPAGAAVTAGLVGTAPRGLAAIRGDLLVQAGTSAGATAASTAPLTGAGLSVGKATLVAATLAGLSVGGGAVAAWNTFSAPPEPSRDLAAPPPSFAEGSSIDEPKGRELASVETTNQQVLPGQVTIPPPAPAAPLPTGDAAQTLEGWLALYAKAHGYTQLYGLGRRVAALPDEEGLAIARAVYPALTVEQRKQFGKPFLFHEGASYGCEVADWIVNDSDEGVRDYGWSFLRRYAFRDFAGDHAAYAAWRGATAGLDRVDTLKVSATWLAEALLSAGPEEAVALLSGGAPPATRTLAALDLRPQEIFAGTGFEASLVPWLDDERVLLASLSATWLPYTDADQATYRTFLVPLLDAGSRVLQLAAARALAASGVPFAAEELSVRFSAQAEPTPNDATDLAFWTQWLARQR